MTALVTGTVLVLGTLDLETADLVVLRIAEVAFLASAGSLAIDHLADGVAATEDWAVARVAALGLSVARFQTAVIVAALLVAAAAHLLDADAVGTDLSVGTLRVVGTGWTTFAFDTLLRW